MQIIPDPIFSALMTLPFLVTFVFLKVLLVDPMRAYLEGREGAIVGARAEAATMQADADAKLADLELKLTQARTAATEIRATHREAGLSVERDTIAQARAKAEGELEAAISEIHAERDAARASIADLAKSLSTDIAGRVLGRDLQA